MTTADIRYGRRGGGWLAEHDGPACSHVVRVPVVGGPHDGTRFAVHSHGVEPVPVDEVPVPPLGVCRLVDNRYIWESAS